MLDIDASSWLFYTKLITMHGHLNIKTNLSNTQHHITSPSKWLSFELRKLAVLSTKFMQ